MKWDKDKPKCVNCHFFCEGEDHIVEDDLRDLLIRYRNYKEEVFYEAMVKGHEDWNLKKIITTSDANEMKQNVISFRLRKKCKCYHGVWDEGLDEELIKKRIENIVRKDRKGECFFWKFKKEMNIIAAKELQKREADRETLREEKEDRHKEAKKDRNILKLGIYLTFVIALFSLLLKLLENSSNIILFLIYLILFLAFIILIGAKLKIPKIFFDSKKNNDQKK